MKPTTCILFFIAILLMNSLKAQTHLAGYELDFYSPHYRYQWKLSKDEIAKSCNTNLKDTVINDIGMSYNSLTLHLPQNEKIDSAELIVSQIEGVQVKIISAEVILIFKKGDPVIFPAAYGRFLFYYLKQLNSLKSGDEIVIRKIKCRVPDGTTRDLTSLNILIK